MHDTALLIILIASVVAAGLSLRVVWLCSKLETFQSESGNGWFGWGAPPAEPLTPAQREEVKHALREFN